MALKTDFKDEILAEGKTNRDYDLVKADGTVVQSDIHMIRKDTPMQEGDIYGAAQVNLLNEEVNRNSLEISKLSVEMNNKAPKEHDHDDRYVIKGDFAILLGTIVIPANMANATGSLSYPPGWNKDNCMLISLQYRLSSDWQTSGVNGKNVISAVLRDNQILSMLYMGTPSTSSATFTIKALLMRTQEA